MIAAWLMVSALAVAGGDAVVARAGGYTITERDLVTRSAALRSLGKGGTPASIVEGLVAEKLLSDEARRRGISPASPTVAARIDSLVREAASQAMMAETQKDLRANDATLRQMFHAEADTLAYESLVFASRDAAAAALKRVQGGASLDAAGAEAVVKRVYAKAADAPRVLRRQVEPALAAALFAAPPGTIVGPVELQTGWSVARALQLDVGSDGRFEEQREDLARRAAKMLASESRKHLADQLRRASGVQIDESFLRSLPGTPPTEKQLAHVIATVKGHAIRYSDIHYAAAAIAAAGGHAAGAAVKIQLVWNEVESRLLQEVAMERGYADRPAVAERRAEFERIALAEEAAGSIRAATPPASDREVRAYYKANAPRFRSALDQIRPAVAEEATAQKRQAAVSSRLLELRKQSGLVIDDAALQKAALALR